MQSPETPTHSYWAEAFFNGTCLFLFICSMRLFVIWMPYSDCQRLSELDHTAYPGVAVPPDAECFYINHGQLRFFSVPERWQNSLEFMTFAILVILPLTVFLAYWYARRRRGAPKKT